MAVGTILIYKLESSDNIGCYEISSSDFNINNFYMRINKSMRTISFFLTKDFDGDPVRVIDCNKDEPMGVIPGIPTMVFSIVLRHALRVFKMDIFPDSLSYAA